MISLESYDKVYEIAMNYHADGNVLHNRAMRTVEEVGLLVNVHRKNSGRPARKYRQGVEMFICSLVNVMSV